MDDVQLRREIAAFQRAEWRSGSLARHVTKHRTDFVDFWGHQLTSAEVKDVSRSLAAEPDRIFTNLAEDMGVCYYFLRMRGTEGAMILVSRGGQFRSLFYAQKLRAWIRRQQPIEVMALGR